MKINNILIGFSLILNSFLLIYLFGLIPFLLFLSFIGNIFVLFYVHFLLNEKNDIQRDFNELMTKSDLFAQHLNNIYELEMFYGDETLEGLITHSRELVNNYYDCFQKYFLIDRENVELPTEENNLDDFETENRENNTNESSED